MRDDRRLLDNRDRTIAARAEDEPDDLDSEEERAIADAERLWELDDGR